MEIKNYYSRINIILISIKISTSVLSTFGDFVYLINLPPKNLFIVWKLDWFQLLFSQNMPIELNFLQNLNWIDVWDLFTNDEGDDIFWNKKKFINVLFQSNKYISLKRLK